MMWWESFSTGLLGCSHILSAGLASPSSPHPASPALHAPYPPFPASPPPPPPRPGQGKTRLSSSGIVPNKHAEAERLGFYWTWPMSSTPLTWCEGLWGSREDRHQVEQKPGNLAQRSS